MKHSEHEDRDGIQAKVWKALDQFRMELPSWGFANTGTRFGKFSQPAAATTIAEKFSDAAEVHRLTGVAPTIALHVLWDFPDGEASTAEIGDLERHHGIRSGSINPNLFQEQEYKFGSLCNPDAAIREKAIEHMLASVRIAKALGSRDVSLWLPDGSNYPGTQSMTRRIGWLEEALARTHAELAPTQRLLVEYKPFEPAFYHTDIADWGMSYALAKAAGPQAVVLVDTGHHYQGTNIEQIVAWLLHLRILGGFHFNDRKYADDDLTLGSIDPYQIFRIFHEIQSFEAAGGATDIAYMIDQSHNLKGKMEAMVQTVAVAQELYARAAMVDQKQLAVLQDECRLVEAEELFRGCFFADPRPMVQAWRVARGLPADPLAALRESGYVEQITGQRSAKNAAVQTSYA
jgi:L-rhamnose isomerase/sugar isomerase